MISKRTAIHYLHLHRLHHINFILSIHLLCIHNGVQHDLQTDMRYQYSQLSPAFHITSKHFQY